MTLYKRLPKATPEDPEYTKGFVRWHGSEPDSGPDVGITLGLGGGDVLWVGTIPDEAYDENDADIRNLGGHTGNWWLIAEPGATPIARFTNRHDAKAFVELLALALRRERIQRSPTGFRF